MISIIHVFTADRHHLVPNMVKYFDNHLTQFNHTFILIGNKRDNIKIYNSENLNSKFFHFKTYKSLETLSLDKTEEQVILHGVPYKWMFYCLKLKIKNLSWVCWGAGAKLNYKNYKSLLFHPFKILMYNKFKKIAVLMDQDASDLQKYYFIKNFYPVSYSLENGGNFPYNKENIGINNFPRNNVYLGNNSASIASYFRITELLRNFERLDRIECMVNYSFEENRTSMALREIGKKYFSDKFFLNTKFYSLEEYYHYMNQCKIYICGVEDQTGLGAIYTTLRLGKKVFLNGKNFKWINSLGCKIFHVNSIESMTETDFLTEISPEEKIRNYNIINDFLDQNEIDLKWSKFFNS